MTSPVLDLKYSNSIEVVREYEKLKMMCGTRTINVLKTLEFQSDYSTGFSNKISFLNHHFFKPFDFKSIKNSGSKTIHEIDQIVESLHSFLKNFNEEFETIPEIQYEQDNQLVKVGIETVKEYQNLKKNCRVRTVNVLENLELEDGFHKRDSAKIAFVEKLFFSPFNYKSLKNSGVRTVEELDNIRNLLWSFVVGFSNKGIPLGPPQALNRLEKHLLKSFPNSEIGVLRVGNKYSIQRVFCAFFSELSLRFNVKLVYHHYLFRDVILSNKEIAEKTQLTRERVRQILKKLNDVTLPGLIGSLRSYKNYLMVENYNVDRHELILEISPIDQFHFNGNDFRTTLNTDRIVLGGFMEDEYVLINDFPVIQDSKNSVFDVKDRLIFLKKEFADEVQMFQLMEFLQDQISEFESIQFDYNLRILIERFYKESGQNLTPQIIEILFSLIHKIKVEDISIDLGKIHRLEKTQKFDEIKRLVENLLNGCQSGIRTQKILDYLNENHFEIGKQQLLAILGKSTQQFARLGHGSWVLREWLPNNEMVGSVREIVEGILINSAKPLHISEILDRFKELRPISEHSLMSNLKVSENFHFHFFNCGFIGLKSKKYDTFWFQIPRLDPRKFTLIVDDQSLCYTDKIKLLEKYQYPRIHCEYLINRREEKRKLEHRLDRHTS